MKRWTAKALGDVCEKITDGSHRTPPFTQQGYPFATVAHVDDDGKIDLASCKRISAADFEELKRNDCRPLPGDVLFSKDGTVGKLALVDFDTDFVVLSSLAILRRSGRRCGHTNALRRRFRLGRLLMLCDRIMGRRRRRGRQRIGSVQCAVIASDRLSRSRREPERAVRRE